jgi:hypothetical protein
MMRMLEKFYTLHAYNFPGRMFLFFRGENVLRLENGLYLFLSLEKGTGASRIICHKRGEQFRRVSVICEISVYFF